MMLVIFISSSTTGTTINETPLNTESRHIIGHLTAFLLLTVTFYKATKNPFKSVFLSAAYALLDEYHQKFTMGRSPSIFDIKVDIIGATIAGIFLWKLQAVLPKKLKNWLSS